MTTQPTPEPWSLRADLQSQVDYCNGAAERGAQEAAQLRTRADERDRQAADLRNQASEYARALALLDKASA